MFIDKEPTYNSKKRIDNWEDLVNFYPEGFNEYFAKFVVKTPFYKLGPNTFQNDIFILVGYKIPKEVNQFELHWDLALLPKIDFPKKKTVISLEKYVEKINWVETHNSSYERFFGRGRLSLKICDSKILIIGIGAIGSSLAEILVRGGIRDLCVADFDEIETGNICRSKYSFQNIGVPKIFGLSNYLNEISPFVNVSTLFGINALSERSEKYQELKQNLSDYDMIFDCSASNEIGEMLTSMSLESTMFCLCITDKANELLCVTNTDNQKPLERLNQMLYSMGSFQHPEFREGIGCWHPTFEASYFDINQLLNYTIKKINQKYELALKPNSFYSFIENDILSSCDDMKYYQKDLKLTLTIESNCLDTICDLVWEHYPKEFGGIFVGNYINGGKEVVISDIIVPTKFKNSNIGFQPDHKELSQKIKALSLAHENTLVYIGDWHSHPNSNNQYSSPDFNSIRDVANSPTVNTKNPILMIIAFSENYFDPGFYVFYDERLYKYEHLK